MRDTPPISVPGNTFALSCKALVSDKEREEVSFPEGSLSTSAFGPLRVVFLFHVTVSRVQSGFYELGEWLMDRSEDGIVLTHAARTAIN